MTFINGKGQHQVRDEENGESKTRIGMLPAISKQTSNGSAQLLPVSDVAISPSMSLIDSSANLLFETMKKVEVSEVYHIEAICECAKNIEKLMRLKFDVLKEGKKK
jgi:hypothetical protein